MSKLIINYTGDIKEALEHVLLVVDMGRISENGTKYSYATRFQDGTLIYANTNRSKTDIFDVEEANK